MRNPTLVAGSVVISTVALVSILLSVLITFSGLPPFVQREASLVYGVDGSIIARIFEENREIVSIGNVSQNLINAIVATEDARFYRHFGIDLIGLARALLEDLRQRRFVQGASTLTQQLARNLFDLPFDRTIRRKLREAYLAILLERNYTKREILELYVNEIYMGHGTYGVEAASKYYFGKSSRDLNLAESAMLAGIIRGPEIYSPRANFKRAKTRQSWVLDRMVRVGYIDAEQAAQAKDVEVIIASPVGGRTGGGYIRDIVRRSLNRNMEDGAALAATAGLRIYTSIDPQMQGAAEKALAELEARTKNRPDQNGVVQPQGALIALDPINGEVRAWVGGRGNAMPQFNRVVDARRQPGSAFKPFVYITALEQGVTAATQVMCEPTTFPLITGQEWTPTDFGARYHDRPLTMREAVVVSCNVVAARLISQVTPEAVVRTAQRLGITTAMNPVLSLALGTSETTALDMAAAFAPLANGGRIITGNVGDPVLRVETRQGRVAYQARPAVLSGALDPRIAYIMTDILRGVITSPVGTGRGAQNYFTRPAAGKTGTSEGTRDAWFVGYTPQLVCAVYVGNDHNAPLDATGGGVAVPIWAQFMRDAHQNLPRVDFARPEGVEEAITCVSSGLLARTECPHELRQTELFLEGTAPAEGCSVHLPAPLFPFPWNWFRNSVEQSSPIAPAPVTPSPDASTPPQESGLDATSDSVEPDFVAPDDEDVDEEYYAEEIKPDED